jgi:hypothetical protein
VGVATVEDLAEEVGEQLDELRRDVLVGGGGKVLDRNRDVPELPPGRLNAKSDADLYPLHEVPRWTWPDDSE